MLMKTFLLIMLLQYSLCDARRNAFQAAYNKAKQAIGTDELNINRVKGTEKLRPYHWLMNSKYFKRSNIF